MLNKQKIHRLIFLIFLVLSVTLSLPNISKAASLTIGTLTQSYNADPSVMAGMIVGLKTKSSNTVVPLNYDNIQKMIGVVVPVNDASIVLTPSKSSNQQVVVAPAGRYQVLVSTQNGIIKSGDFLTVSALSGVAMKASSDQNEIIGQAFSNYYATNNEVIGTAQLKNVDGQNKKVLIGHIPVNLRLSSNPLYQNTITRLPGKLSGLASSIANKPVSLVRAYLSFSVLVGTLLITGILVFSVIRNSIKAVGRNPLARKTINKAVINAVVVAFIIFITGIFAVYLILI